MPIMHPTKFKTVVECDLRLIWLNVQIEIMDKKYLAESYEPVKKQYRGRCTNLRHERHLIEVHRQKLLTPELI